MFLSSPEAKEMFGLDDSKSKMVDDYVFCYHQSVYGSHFAAYPKAKEILQKQTMQINCGKDLMDEKVWFTVSKTSSSIECNALVSFIDEYRPDYVVSVLPLIGITLPGRPEISGFTK